LPDPAPRDRIGVLLQRGAVPRRGRTVPGRSRARGGGDADGRDPLGRAGTARRPPVRAARGRDVSRARRRTRAAACGWLSGMSEAGRDRTGVVRVAAVGDLHCTKTSAGELQAIFAAASRAADVLLLCGDLTDYGLPEEAEVLASELRAALRIPALAVFGNH